MRKKVETAREKYFYKNLEERITLVIGVIGVVRLDGPVSVEEIAFIMREDEKAIANTVWKLYKQLPGVMLRHLAGPKEKRVYHYFIDKQQKNLSTKMIHKIFLQGKQRQKPATFERQDVAKKTKATDGDIVKGEPKLPQLGSPFDKWWGTLDKAEMVNDTMKDIANDAFEKGFWIGREQGKKSAFDSIKKIIN